MEIKRDHPKKDILAITLGADNPFDLESGEALQFAASLARKERYTSFLEAEDDVRLYGQNCLAERAFFFGHGDGSCGRH